MRGGGQDNIVPELCRIYSSASARWSQLEPGPLLSLAAVLVVLAWSLVLRYFQREEEDTTSGAMELGQELSKPGPRRKVRVRYDASSRCVEAVDISASKRCIRRFVITEKVPTRAFSSVHNSPS